MVVLFYILLIDINWDGIRYFIKIIIILIFIFIYGLEDGVFNYKLIKLVYRFRIFLIV